MGQLKNLRPGSAFCSLGPTGPSRGQNSRKTQRTAKKGGEISDQNWRYFKTKIYFHPRSKKKTSFKTQEKKKLPFKKQKEQKDQKPIKQLIESSNLAGYKVIALNSPFEKKDILKSNSYFWDSLNKYWWKSIKDGELENEKSWLENNVYDGDFMGQVEMIMPNDRYK